MSEKLALPRQPLHETHTHEGNRHAAAKIRASPARVVLVAWEHRNIPLLGLQKLLEVLAVLGAERGRSEVRAGPAGLGWLPGFAGL